MLRTLSSILLAAALTLPAGAARAQVWVPVWTASAMPDRGDTDRQGQPHQFADQTVRQDLQLASTVKAVRIRFSNELGKEPLVLGATRAGLRGGPLQPVLFDGKPGATIAPGASLLSDVLELEVPALAELTVSVHLPEPTRPAVRLSAVRFAAGDSEVPDTMRLQRRQSVVSAVLGERTQAPEAVVVALGDSITEGGSTTLGANRSWPSRLGQRLEERCPGAYVVVNAGIGGNMVVGNGRSPSAISRLDRDVLSLPGVTHVILLEGLNDIRQKGPQRDRPGASAEDVIAGYRQVVDRLRMHGIKVIGGTLTPILAAPVREPVIEGPSTEDKRRALNDFIRGSGLFDAVVDFEAATADPRYPGRIRAGAHREDGYHPNDEGHRLMAGAVDPALFGPDRCGR